MWRCTICKFLAKTEWDKEAHWHRVVDVQHSPHIRQILKATGEGLKGVDWMFTEIDDHYYGPGPVEGIDGGWKPGRETKKETEWQPSPERRAILDALRESPETGDSPPFVGHGLEKPAEKRRKR
jgi:hypothetical protein